MKNYSSYLFLFLLPLALLMVAPEVFAGTKAGATLRHSDKTATITDALLQDPPAKSDKKQDEGQAKKKRASKEPDIKEVPKSKRQVKPVPVKGKVKIKTPVKKIKPVIKKPVKPIRKKLGI